MPVDLQASGWRLVDRPGRDVRRAKDLMERDLDGLAEVGGDHQGPIKIQACGPWTLAASVELHYGDKVLADPGAVRDLAGSLAEGVATHVADVGRRVPGARVLVQLDEPSLPAVLAGAVRTASGFATLRRPAASTVESTLRTLIEAVGAPVLVHCCASAVPYGQLRRAGAVAVSVDLSLLDLDDARAVDALAAELDGGMGLFGSSVPAVPGGVSSGDVSTRPSGSGELSDPDASVMAVRALWHRVGLDPGRLPEQVVVTPACGLAGATVEYATGALGRCREGARRLLDDPEG
jgi:hypothetical protein